MGENVQYLTDNQGQRTAVVLPISDYEKLLEDSEDLAIVAERRDDVTVSHKDFMEGLKQDGAI